MSRMFHYIALNSSTQMEYNEFQNPETINVFIVPGEEAQCGPDLAVASSPVWTSCGASPRWPGGDLDYQRCCALLPVSLATVPPSEDPSGGAVYLDRRAISQGGH